MQRKRTYTWNELSGQSSEVNSDNKTDPHVAYFTMKNGLDESLINRELLTKLGALQEMIKNLQDENSFLRSENYRIKSAVSENKSNSIEEKELQAVILNYQKKAKDMTEKITELEKKLELTAKNEEIKSAEKSRYKPLARKLKEERNIFKEMIEKINKENKVLKEEVEKMKQLSEKLRWQCKSLKTDLILEKSKATCCDAEAQTDTREVEEEEEEEEGDDLPDPDPEVKDKLDECLNEYLHSSLNLVVQEDQKENLTLKSQITTPIFSDSALLVEEEEETQENIEEIQAVIAGHDLRGGARTCLQSDQKRSSGGSIYWSLMSKTFLKKFWQSQSEHKDISS